MQRTTSWLFRGRSKCISYLTLTTYVSTKAKTGQKKPGKLKKRPVFFSAFGFRAPKKRAQKGAKKRLSGKKNGQKQKNGHKKPGKGPNAPVFFFGFRFRARFFLPGFLPLVKT